jgi:hypothetical protein
MPLGGGQVEENGVNSDGLKKETKVTKGGQDEQDRQDLFTRLGKRIL